MIRLQVKLELESTFSKQKSPEAFCCGAEYCADLFPLHSLSMQKFKVGNKVLKRETGVSFNCICILVSFFTFILFMIQQEISATDGNGILGNNMLPCHDIYCNVEHSVRRI